MVIVDVMLSDGSAHHVVARLSKVGIPFVVHSGDPLVMREEGSYASGTWMSKPSLGRDLAEAAWKLAEAHLSKELG